ncbi:MAG: DUF421 domain-containing protein [Alphaproteobacteria bacterium]|nr:DUF421 domain-containing protein [Alphaproteobacteria bacterium]
MFALETSWWELVLRAALVYFAILGLLRLVGKRQVGEMAPFDIVVLTLISASASKALRADDGSITAAVIAIATILALNTGIALVRLRAPAIERLLEGRPTFLVRNSKVEEEALRSERMSRDDLMLALREHGCFDLDDVEYAVLETTGTVSVKKHKRTS